MPHLRTVEEALRAYLDQAEPELQRFLYDTWNAEAAAIKLEAIQEALAHGRFSQTWLEKWRQAYSKFVNEKVKPLLEAALEKGAAAGLSDLGIATDLSAAAIRNWVETRMGAMITRLSDSQRDAVNTVISHFIFDPDGVPNPVGVARYLRPIIGLTAQQEAAVWRRYQDLLISESVSKTEAIRQANVYADKLRVQRAETIARTEMAGAFNQGHYEGVRQAARDGLLTGPVTKEWMTAEDEKVCPVCSALGDEDPIELDETYQLDDGTEILTSPAHPRCRCSMRYRVERAIADDQPEEES